MYWFSLERWIQFTLFSRILLIATRTGRINYKALIFLIFFWIPMWFLILVFYKFSWWVLIFLFVLNFNYRALPFLIFWGITLFYLSMWLRHQLPRFILLIFNISSIQGLILLIFSISSIQVLILLIFSISITQDLFFSWKLLYCIIQPFQRKRPQ